MDDLFLFDDSADWRSWGETERLIRSGCFLHRQLRMDPPRTLQIVEHAPISVGLTSPASETDAFGPLSSFQASLAPPRLLRAGNLCMRKDPIMAIGTVKFFNMDRGYGFITNEAGGPDAFVHISAVERAGMGSLKEGQKVSYELETGQNGKTSAVNLADAS
jgi:cold shock protein